MSNMCISLYNIQLTLMAIPYNHKHQVKFPGSSLKYTMPWVWLYLRSYWTLVCFPIMWNEHFSLLSNSQLPLISFCSSGPPIPLGLSTSLLDVDHCLKEKRCSIKINVKEREKERRVKYLMWTKGNREMFISLVYKDKWLDCKITEKDLGNYWERI